MKTQLSKPARGRASYTEEYKQEALGLEIRFVRLGPQVLSRFVQSLGRRVFWGLNAKFHRIYLPLRAPESFARLCKTCRVALFDGPVATPFAKSTDPKVDLITVNWKALATRPRGATFSAFYAAVCVRSRGAMSYAMEQLFQHDLAVMLDR